MSYINDKEKMKKEADEHRRLVWTAVKITFVAIAALLLVFCITLGVSLFAGSGGDDKEAPVIKGPGVVIGYLGEAPTYLSYVEVSDDKDPDPMIHVKADSVDINKVGSYEVYYVAVDSEGNRSLQFTLVYEVKEKQFSEESLMEQIAELCEDLGITKNMSKEAQVRAIYKYVNSRNTIFFTDESNIPNATKRRNRWKTDWVEEAVRSIESGEGDCYSYYSLSKAFFEYLGIENQGIKRDESYLGAGDDNDGTHFWSVVKIEQGWYYYDATRLKGKFNDGSVNACLITQAKLDSYRANDCEEHPCQDYFYKMSPPIGFPNISTKELG